MHKDSAWLFGTFVALLIGALIVGYATTWLLGLGVLVIVVALFFNVGINRIVIENALEHIKR